MRNEKTDYSLFNFYLNHDYASAFDTARELWHTEASLILLQISLISLQRLGHETAAAHFGEQALTITEKYPWDQTLIALTLGQADPNEILSQANRNEQKCQVFYYAAARLETIGETIGAQQIRLRCLDLGVDCVEHRLARMEVSERYGAELTGYEDHQRRIHDLNCQSSQLLHEGKYDQAAPVATQAYELARRLLPRDHPDLANSINNLAGIFYTTGNYFYSGRNYCRPTRPLLP